MPSPTADLFVDRLAMVYSIHPFMPKPCIRNVTFITVAVLSVSVFPLQANAGEELSPVEQKPAAEQSTTSREVEQHTPPTLTQTGLASWYGGSFIGGKTANGERYRPSERTAAHRTLPFGTYVRVTNLRNNRSAVVRINNRGPYIRKRIIDLSRQAAADLAMLKSGTARVRLEVLSKEVAVAELAALGADN